MHLFPTDDLGRDKFYIPRMLESLLKKQQMLDSITTVEAVPPLPKRPYDPQFTTIASTKTDIKNCVSAMRDMLGGRRIVGLDCKWKVLFHRCGMDGQDKVALIQIC